MDLDKIKLVVLNQLINASSLYSLKLQNHLYGCFIVMEDIAQGSVKVGEGNSIIAAKYTFNLDKQFAEIGIRYGFAMDSKLVLEGFGAEYKLMWLNIFSEVKSVAESDRVEDCIIETIQKIVKAEDAFFINALETGSLPQEWVERVFALLAQPTTPPNTPEAGVEVEKEEAVQTTALTKAAAETPMHASSHLRTRAVAKTRRAKRDSVAAKKALAKTRRNIK
jgi:hypothetical protein